MAIPYDQNELKKLSAIKAVEFIKDGMIVGLGTGSTMQFALEEIARLRGEGKLQNIIGIPTSERTKNEADRLGIPLTTLDVSPVIDLTVDGADEVDKWLNVIKGGGGAHLHEKIIAQASKEFIVIVDESKISDYLGEKFYVPVEVIKKGIKPVSIYIEELGAEVKQRINKDGTPYLTDENNYILQCYFKDKIDNPSELSNKLSSIAGIVEHGLFVSMANRVVVSGAEGVYIKVSA